MLRDLLIFGGTVFVYLYLIVRFWWHPLMWISGPLRPLDVWPAGLAMGVIYVFGQRLFVEDAGHDHDQWRLLSFSQAIAEMWNDKGK